MSIIIRDMSLLKTIGIPDIQNNLEALHQQAIASSELDTIANPQSIKQIGGNTKLSKTLREKVIKKMSHKIVEQHGGKMVTHIKVNGHRFRCEALKMGKNCRYLIQYA